MEVKPPLHFYRRYVDDIFAVFDKKEDALKFLDYLNSRHPNIKFTKEENINGVLPFLDVLISNRNCLKTSVYHKSTYTGLLTNFKSFVPFDYKKRLVNTLLDRIFKINSSWVGFDTDVESLKTKIIKMFKTFCKPNVHINVVFTVCKLRSYFSTKDLVPSCFKSNVVYSFICPRCESCYVGRTHTHFDTRRKQHLGKDSNSSILLHLKKSKECKQACDFDAFKILDTAKTNYELAIKESVYIKWHILNVQKKHAILNLLV